MSDRSEALQEWERCAWCWRPLPDHPTRRGGYPYCDDRCAGKDVGVVLEGDEEVSMEQTELEL